MYLDFFFHMYQSLHLFIFIVTSLSISVILLHFSDTIFSFVCLLIDKHILKLL